MKALITTVLVLNFVFLAKAIGLTAGGLTTLISPEQFVFSEDINCLPDDDDGALQISKNLKYIGMMGGMGSDTFNLEKWKSDVYATLKMGNIQVLQFLNLPDDPTLEKSFTLFRQKLLFLAQFKVGLVVWVQELLFEPTGHIKNSAKLNWNKMVGILTPFKHKIKTFYLFDEPFWNVEIHKNNNDLQFVNADEMYKNLNTIGLLIRNSFPKKPLTYVEAYAMINDSLKIPEVFDWIGMDCYTGFENCEGHSIPEYYQILKKLKPGKKLVVLPSAIIFKKPQDISLLDRQKLKDLYITFMNWVSTESEIIVSLSFIYRYEQATEVFTGANQLCESRDIHKLFWRKFYLYQ